MNKTFHFSCSKYHSGFIIADSVDIQVIDRITKVTWNSGDLGIQLHYTVVFNTNSFIEAFSSIRVGTTLFEHVNNIIGSGHIQVYYDPKFNSLDVSIDFIGPKQFQICSYIDIIKFNKFVSELTNESKLSN